METSYSFITIFLSISTGLIAGLLLVYSEKYPKTRKGVLYSFLGLLLAPSIGVNTYLIGDATTGTLQGICLAPFLTAFFFIIASAGLLTYVGIDISNFTKQRNHV